MKQNVHDCSNIIGFYLAGINCALTDSVYKPK